MEENKSKLWEKGVIVSLILIVWSLVTYFTGQIMNFKMLLVSILIFMICIVIATIMFSKQHKGQVTFGNLFAHGFKISCIIALIMILWQFLMTKVIFPDIPAKVEQYTREMMLKYGMTEQQITESIANNKKHEVVYTIARVLISFGIVGAISALLGAAFAKKTPANSSPFQQ